MIELLVVVAIIALLVSILLPSLRMAKELARDTVCASNVKGLMTAEFLYAEANDGALTRIAGQGKDRATPLKPILFVLYRGEEGSWCDLLVHGGFAAAANFVCPTVSYTRDDWASCGWWNDPFGAADDRLPNSYGFNRYMGPGIQNWPVDVDYRTENLTGTPSDCIVLSDSNRATREAWPVYDNDPACTRHHADSCTHAFADGHVDPLCFETVYGIPWDPDLYINYPYAWADAVGANPGEFYHRGRKFGDWFPLWAPW